MSSIRTQLLALECEVKYEIKIILQQATFKARAGPGPRVPVPSTTAKFTTRDIFGSVFTWKHLKILAFCLISHLALVHPTVPEDDPGDLQGPVRGPLVVEKGEARR